MNKKQYIGIIIFILLIAGVTFYWYAWRPNQIKKSCSAKVEKDQFDIMIASPETTITSEFYKNEFNKCLNENGL